MPGYAGHPDAAIALPAWSLLFAREPEPDPDLDDIPPESVEENRTSAPRPPMQRPPNRKPLIFLVLLILVAGVTYLSLNLETLTGMLPESVLDLLGEAPPSPTPSAPGEEMGPAARPSPAVTPPATPLPVAIPVPGFAEGQRVMVSADPTNPGMALSLSGDAAGTTPGPPVRAGAVVTVLDGEFQANSWVYAVKTQEGTKGWLPETRLKATP
jgi:hypothetical protein